MSSRPPVTELASELGIQVIAAGREMLARGLVVSTAGNVSARYRDGLIIKPTRWRYSDLQVPDLVALDLAGGVLGGDLEPSTEWRLHAAVYAARADVEAIVHTHSPFATAWSFGPEPLSLDSEDERYFGLGDVRVAAWAPAGSRELADAAVQALGEAPAALLARHGALAVGAAPRDALETASVVERQAELRWLVARR